MKIPSNFFSNGGIEKLRKTSRGIGPRDLVSKNQLLSSKIAVCSPRTDRQTRTQTEKTKLRDPFFFFFSNPNKKNKLQKKGRSNTRRITLDARD